MQRYATRTSRECDKELHCWYCCGNVENPSKPCSTFHEYPTQKDQPMSAVRCRKCVRQQGIRRYQCDPVRSKENDREGYNIPRYATAEHPGDVAAMIEEESASPRMQIVENIASPFGFRPSSSVSPDLETFNMKNIAAIHQRLEHCLSRCYKPIFSLPHQSHTTKTFLRIVSQVVISKLLVMWKHQARQRTTSTAHRRFLAHPAQILDAKTRHLNIS